jgi:HEAT repeat protein
MKIAAAIACVALVAAVGLDAQRRVPQPPRPRNKAAITAEAVLLAADRIRADRWYPEGTIFDGARALNRAADMDLLVIASESQRPDLRRLAVREFGRFETPSNTEFISRYLDDDDPGVRIEAADALVQSGVARPDLAPAAIENIRLRLRHELDPKVIAAFWNVLTQLPLSHQVSAEFEAQLLNEIQQQSPMRIQAGHALVELLWNLRGRPALSQTVRSLREWFLLGVSTGGSVQIGSTTIGSAATFLEGLHAARVDEDFLLERAYVSASGGIRGRAVDMSNPFNPVHRAHLEEMAKRGDVGTRDAAILRLLSNPDVPLCDLLPLATAPLVEQKVLQALAASKNAAHSACGDWSPYRALVLKAETLRGNPGPRAWQMPMLALELVAPHRPEEIGPLAREVAAKHAHWLVRATAARVAAVLNDADLALQLMDDSHPNVRADALRSLATLRHPLTTALAVTALEAKDYHLVRTAAIVLEAAPEPLAILPVLVTTIERVTNERKDTSRELRLMLLERIREFGMRVKEQHTGWSLTLVEHVQDFDPVIAQQVSQLIFAVTGKEHPATPKHRPAAQPTEAEIRTAPPCVIVQFDHAEPWVIALDRERAPLAVTRFWALAEKGYYMGQDVVHADKAVALTGSPGGNDFVTTDRFIRDEIGAVVRAGSIVMLGHGRDTLDGRLQHIREERRDRTRLDTVIGWARVSYEDLDTKPLLEQPPLPGHRIMRIVKCDDK